jgi:PAS domain S-box-containing protein
VSPSVERLTGESVEKHLARPLREKHPPESVERLTALFREEMDKEQDPQADKSRTRLIEVEYYRADGSRVWLAMNLSFIRDADGKAVGIQGVSRDISERKKAQEMIRKNEQRLESLLRITQYQATSTQDFLDYALDEAIRLTDSRLGYIYFYDDVEKRFVLNTWSKEVMKECTVVGAPNVYDLDKTGIWGEAVRQARPIVVNDFQAPHPLKRGYPEGHAHLHKYMTVPVFNNGRIVAVAGVANKEADYDEADVRQLTLLMDSVWRITEQKKSELACHQAEEKYRNIVENAQEGIFQSTREGRFLTANQAMAAILDYESPEDLMKSVTDLDVQIYTDPEDRRELLLAAEMEGQVAGFETQYLRKDGSPIWVSINKRAVRDEKGRLLFYEGFVEDITSRKISMEQIRRALGATVQAIAVTVEARDPYTAGHQRRVADLARVIAVEMRLSHDQIEGLRMAGIIHDLGKITVPSEILSKPTRLTELECSLVKTHSEAGFNILKDIEFPWPVARIVLEHHERINGSGYPYGKTGDALLTESKILMVADVVEAMASDRPYRAGLGIGSALDEISRHRGILYDPEVVDTCLWLFREQNYQFTL